MTDPTRIPLPEPMWFVCTTAPRREFDADIGLRRRGINTWIPFDRVRVRVKRHSAWSMTEPNPEWIKRLHFPRYVFAALCFAHETIELVESAEYVSRVVRRKFSQEPLRIPNEVMGDLMARAEVDGTVEVEDEAGGGAEERILFDDGELVMVRKGHILAGNCVTVVKDRGSKMVDIDYEATRMRISIPAAYLERMEHGENGMKRAA